MSRSYSRLGAFILAAFVLFYGCGKKDRAVISAELEKQCVIVHAENPKDRSTWSAWLERYMAATPRYTIAQLDAAIDHCLEHDLALILADQLSEPSQQTALSDYLERGSRLVLLGHDHAGAESDRAALRTIAGLIDPPYKITNDHVRINHDGSTISLPGLGVTSPSPPAPGYGGTRGRDIRWIPVAEVLGPNGAVAGWAASCTIKSQPAYQGFSIFGWIGIAPARHDMKELGPIVSALLTEATRHVYLYNYGLDRHAADSQSSLQINAEILDRRLHDKSPLRVVARWLNDGGMEIRRHASQPMSPPFVPMSLSIGLAPEPGGQAAGNYAIEIMIRDRSDQITLDRAQQTLKIFPRDYPVPVERITVNGTQLMHGPKPMFMLGVNYWPRLGAPHAGSSANGHWLAPEWFAPDVVRSDLDLLAAANMNAIAIEYTSIAQAPQLAFVLDELRQRGMWASVYVPALHPLDLHMEEALAMLQALRLERWPEVFAIEMARGLSIPSRTDMRRFDDSWADWLESHFSSVSEAEQKTGVSLWMERGRAVGPPDEQLARGPQHDRAIALYFTFLQDFASRRMGYVRHVLRAKGYDTLLTTRSAYGMPGPASADALDISTGVLHVDFLSPEAWTIHPLEQTHNDGPSMAAYVRGVGGGKPVVWSAFGQDVGRDAAADSLSRQADVYRHMLDLFINEGSAGALAWWFPAGAPLVDGRDWGIMLPNGQWRPVEESIRAARTRLRQVRLIPPRGERVATSINQSASQWRDAQISRRGIFPGEPPAKPITEWLLPGTGFDTGEILNERAEQNWSAIDGLHVLNAEWGSIRIDQTSYERRPDSSVRSYAGRPLEMEIMNSGTARWIAANRTVNGAVSVRISQPGFPDEWISPGALERGGRSTLSWVPREPGVWEAQAFLAGYGKFGELLRLEITTPPGLF